MKTSPASPADDDAFFEALAGRSMENTPPHTRLEAEMLRGAARRHAAESQARRDMASEATDEKRLLEALEARFENRKAPGSVAGCEGCAARRLMLRELWLYLTTGWRAAVAAITVATLAGLLVVVPMATWWQAAAPAGDDVLRGPGLADVPVLVAATAEDAEQRRNELARVLAANGARVQRYQRLGRYGLDAQLTEPTNPAVLQALRAHGLVASHDGSVHIEFAAPAP